jgi:hypothetical protein
MVYFCVPTIRILKKRAIKKSNNCSMLYRIHFESFDSKGIMCSYYSFLLKECKGMCKMMQLISKNLCKKNMFPFIQLHIHYVNLMKKKIT